MNLFLGIDLGSVSTNIAILDEDGELVARQYVRTSGDPISAIQLGISKAHDLLNEHFKGGDYTILGVGATGSARDLAAKITGADVVKNEITTHAIAACTIDPDVRTIFEIGGQDSKIVLVNEGRVTDFAMNTVCAAGTGSFLDNQAERLGIPIEEFGDLTLEATTDVRIAGRCTVFAESDMIHKQQLGFTTPDIVKGLCEAMVRNYINNVGSGKEILQPAFFQGGVAANKGIKVAFEKELGFEVIIPPNFDIMGAIGAAILAKDRYERSQAPTSFYGFDLVNFTYEMESYDCPDCPNICEVVQLSINGEAKHRWGDKCGKWQFLGEGALQFPEEESRDAPVVASESTCGLEVPKTPGLAEECAKCDDDAEVVSPLTSDGVERKLECPDCSKKFEFLDTGTRPISIECPHCGVKGVLE